MSFLEALKVGAARLPPKPALAQKPSATTPGPAPTLAIDLTLYPFRLVPLVFLDAVGEASRGLQDVLDLDEQAIFAGCGFLHDALATGGQHHPEPLWHLTVLAATWFKDGRTVAHAMSNKHAGYVPGDTDDKYDRKVKDRADKDLGWPQCSTISGYGCKACATCPHLAEGKSPLNLGIVIPAVTAVGNDAAKFVLPDGYMFNTEGYVCYIEHVKEKTAQGFETREVPVPVLDKQYILVPVVHKGPPPQLTFNINGTVGEVKEVSIERSLCASPTDTLRRLIDQGVRPTSAFKLKLGDFFMSLIGKIEQHVQSTQSKPLGWVEDRNAKSYSKFSYGARTFNPDGTTSPGGYLDDEMKNQYNPVGDLAVWKEAAKFITDQKRQDFALFLACTVAAPLMQFAGGQNIGVGSFYGDSGKGKSFVLKTAAAFWGHPESSRLSQSSTVNHLGYKAGILANLPIFWDEVSLEEHQKAVLSFAMQDGRERGRLMSQSGGVLKVRHAGEWSTILATTSNPSLVGYVARLQRDSASGRYRIFEWKVETHHPMQSKWSVDPYLAKLKFNFGMPGLVYAEYLAKRSSQIEALLTETGREFDKKVNAKPMERFWSTFCACILLGAKFNVELGLIDFDIPALEDYLVKMFLKQRQALEDDGQEGSEMGREILTAFIKEHFQNILITDGLPAPGGAKGTPFKILKQPAAHMAKGIHVQWVNRAKEPIVRISRNRLNEWLRDKKYNSSVVYDRVKHRITAPVVLGGKTSYAAGPERVIQIELYPGHFLYEVMNDLYSVTQST